MKMNERQPGGLVQRCVIIHRDENGYGLTVSGDNPVYVQSVKENCAAAKSGVQVGDRIMKVNGMLVTQSNHIEVVRLIKSGSFVALTLLGKDNTPKSPEIRSNHSKNGGHMRSRSLGNNLSFHVVQQPVVTDPKQNEKVQDNERMLNNEHEYHHKILEEYMRAPSQKSQQELADSQTRINALEHQIKVLSGSISQKSPGFSPSTRQAFCSVPENQAWTQPLQSRTQSLVTHKSTGSPSSEIIGGNNLHPREGIESQNIQKQSDSVAKIPLSSSAPNIESDMNDPKQSKLDQNDRHDGGPPYNLPPLPNNGSDNSFDSLFQKAQYDNLSQYVPLHTAASVISMEEDEFDADNEKFDDHGPFIDLTVLKDKPAHLAVFLHFLMSNNNPSALFFWLVTDTYSQETGTVKELKKWAYEIYSTFVAQTAPLKVDIDEVEEFAIEDALENPKSSEERIKNVFDVARSIIFTEVNDQLTDFRNKRALGLGGLFGDHQLEDDLDRSKELKVIEQTLLPHLDALMTDIDSPNESQSDRNSAMASALATFMKQVGLPGKASWNRPSNLDRCRSFAEKEKSSIKLFSKKKAHTINGHQFVGAQYTNLTLCGYCDGLLWGIGTQGYQCTVCEFNVHKRSCAESLTELCPGRKIKTTKRPTLRTRGRLPHTEVKAQTLRIDENLDSNSNSHNANARGRGSSVNDEKLATECDTDKVAESEQERTGTPHEDTPKQKSSTISYIRKVPPIVPRNVLRSESLKSVRDMRPPKSKMVSGLPGLKSSSAAENGVYGPAPFHPSGSSTKVDSPPPESEEEDETDSDLEVETEIPNWQESADKKILRRLKNKEVKRQEVIHELIHTEKTHVRNLKVLNKVFYRPMQRKKIIPPNQIRQIFPNLGELIEIHESLLVLMKKRAAESEVIENIGDIMLDRFDGEAGEQVKRAAATFCSAQKSSLGMLKKLLLTKKELQAFMLKQETNPLCRRLKFTDIIASTHQRLVKYPMLLQGINKATPPPHSDYKNVDKCTRCCKGILNHVNQEIREAENKLRLEVLKQKIEDKRGDNTEEEGEGKFDITNHTMLHEGGLIWKINTTKKLDLHVVLLDDILVLLQKQDERYILKTHSTTAGGADGKGSSPSPIIRLSNVITRDVATDKKAFFLIGTSVTGSQIYELAAQSMMEKKTWVHLINQQSELTKGKDNDRGRRGGLALAATAPSLTSHQEEEEEDKEDVKANSEEENTKESDLGSLTTISTEASDDCTVMSIQATCPSKERMVEICDELTAKDEELEKIIEEKSRLLAEMRVNVDMEPKELVLAAISQTNRLTTAVNEVLTVNKDAVDSQHMVISDSISTLNEVLTTLLASVTSRDNQLGTLKSSVESAKATIQHLKQATDMTDGDSIHVGSMDSPNDEEDDDDAELSVTPTPPGYIPAVAASVEENNEEPEDSQEIPLPTVENDIPKQDEHLLVTSPFKMFCKRVSDPNGEILMPNDIKPTQINRAASFSGFSSSVGSPDSE